MSFNWQLQFKEVIVDCNNFWTFCTHWWTECISSSRLLRTPVITNILCWSDMVRYNRVWLYMSFNFWDWPAETPLIQNYICKSLNFQPFISAFLKCFTRRWATVSDIKHLADIQSTKVMKFCQKLHLYEFRAQKHNQSNHIDLHKAKNYSICKK
jgi:hypothetical protein